MVQTIAEMKPKVMVTPVSPLILNQNKDKDE